MNTYEAVLEVLNFIMPDRLSVNEMHAEFYMAITPRFTSKELQ